MRPARFWCSAPALNSLDRIVLRGIVVRAPVSPPRRTTDSESAECNQPIAVDELALSTNVSLMRGPVATDMGVPLERTGTFFHSSRGTPIAAPDTTPTIPANQAPVLMFWPRLIHWQMPSLCPDSAPPIEPTRT